MSLHFLGVDSFVQVSFELRKELLIVYCCVLVYDLLLSCMDVESN